MKRIIICTTILLFISSTLYSKNNRGVLITQQDYTYIFDVPNGSVVDSIRNEPDLDRIYSITIEKIRGKWIKVKAYDLMVENITYHTGWVERGVVGVYLKDFSHIKVYEQPNIQTNIKKSPINLEWGPYVVYDMKNEWLLIEYIYNGISQLGWIPAKYQASNPYTTEN